MTAIAIVQARTRSTRFPRKVLADLCGHPVLWHVVTRAKAIQGVDKVVVACPESDGEVIRDLNLGVDVVAYTKGGDENDVLSRFEFVAHAFPADRYVRLTADCPLLAPDLAMQVMDAMRWGVAYSCTRYDGETFGWPDGLDCECFTADALSQADLLALPAEREHVTLAMRVLLPAEHQVALPCPVQWPAGVKLSIDTPADLDYARLVMARLPEDRLRWRSTWWAVNTMGTPPSGYGRGVWAPDNGGGIPDTWWPGWFA
jgi:spore coat polysaccharide biosynthesis protein SpsF